MNCKNCNSLIKQGDIFCQNCGAKVSFDNVSNYENDINNINVAQGKSWGNMIKTSLIITGIAVILIAILTCIMINSSGENSDFDSDTFGFFMVIIVPIGIFIIASCINKSKKDKIVENRYNTIFKTPVDNNTSNYMDQILRSLGYKLINYKGEQVYFSNNSGGFVFGSSVYDRYIKFQVIPEGIRIQAWVLHKNKEMGLEGDFGIAIKTKLKSDLDYIYNSIVIK